MSDILATLMVRLGYERYGAQGGDRGGIISRSLAGNYPEHVIGLHSNFILGGPAPGVDPAEGVSPEEMAMREERTEAFAEGSALRRRCHLSTGARGQPALFTRLLLRPAMHRTQRCVLISGCSTYCVNNASAPLGSKTPVHTAPRRSRDETR